MTRHFNPRDAGPEESPEMPETCPICGQDNWHEAYNELSQTAQDSLARILPCCSVACFEAWSKEQDRRAEQESAAIEEQIALQRSGFLASSAPPVDAKMLRDHLAVRQHELGALCAMVRRDLEQLEAKLAVGKAAPASGVLQGAATRIDRLCGEIWLLQGLLGEVPL